MENYLFIDGKKVLIENEKNLLEIIRKAGVELPTFCYHSELSVYGACRLCIVDIEGRGVLGACSTRPEPNMKVKTNTNQIRNIRKITLELLLANDGHNCTSCSKNSMCKLQDISRKLGVGEVRFKKTELPFNIDISTPSLVRDPNKCILCGDCVRACKEIQSIGAIDFAFRGSQSMVLPAFGKDLAEVECVDCGQCARVCPTGAITPKTNIDVVFEALNNKDKFVVAQIAPAVRIALGEVFGEKPGVDKTGEIVSALKMMGFDKVFDTSFAADLTIFEEATELIHRKQKGEKLPQFTSCCPGWVKFAEQYFPELLGNLSSCRSPQQMFGSLAKEVLTKEYNVKPENFIVVSIMPCTAKKFEATRPEFTKEGVPDVDHVITTQELAKMIEETGIIFKNLEPESLDLPLGFKTGAGVLFGNSGGVMEAALRYAYEKISGEKLENVDFHEVRGNEGIKEAEIAIKDTTLKVAVVHSLKNARALAEKVVKGEVEYDFVEVMACPGGCIGGAGQPVTFDTVTKKERTKGIYKIDKNLQLHKSQDNPFVVEAYNEVLEEVGSHKAHELLHTEYSSRKRINDTEISLIKGKEKEKVEVSVCVGTSCYVKGSQKLLYKLIDHIEDNGLKDKVDVNATFCFEDCDKGPTVKINNNKMHHCNFEIACSTLMQELEKNK